MRPFRLLIWIVLMGLASGTQAGGRSENRFGSIYIDDKKAGQIHYTIEYGEGGDVETLKTRASLSIFGVRVFNFEQNLHEAWRRGELHQLRGRTDDDGKIYEASLDRGSELYKGTLNGKPVELPDKAFPASVWHYAIVDRSLLFDLKALTLLNVRIARSEETLTVATRRIAAERFEFSGDWQATVWFDRNRQLVQFRYVVDGHKVVVQLEE